jgi:hypothetical protein
MSSPPSPPQGFLENLYGPTIPDECRIALWEKPTKRSTYLSKPEEANVFEGKPDVYVTSSLVPAGLSQGQRIKAQESKGIPGVWLDIDLNGGPENKEHAAPDLEAARRLADSELEPTLLVNSGYGLQAWWLFEEPWLFDNDEERSQAMRVTHGWHVRHNVTARRHGYKIDSTFDLARLMRLPGTANGKGGLNVPVIELDYDGPRHRMEAVVELALAVAPLAVERPKLQGGTELPLLKFQTLESVNDLFKRTWEHTRKDRASEGWSLSEYDLSLASFAIHAGWSDEEVGALVAAHRRKWQGESAEKGSRTDYLERTIVRARTVIRKDERDQLHQRELEKLGELGEDPDPSHKDAVFSAFNTVLAAGQAGAPVVKELVQFNSDPDEARFVLVLDDGTELNISPYGNLREPRKLDSRIAPTTGFVMERLRDSPEWRLALRTLMMHRDLREEPEDPILDWARKYLEDSLAGLEREKAATTGEPFKEDGFVYLRTHGLAHYLRTTLRERRGAADLPPLLRKAGFRQENVHYEKKGKRTTSAYWLIEERML